ncbi:MAG: fibrillarin-like rRNA/tRNA 2'-O-methyltransferase [archaeon]
MKEIFENVFLSRGKLFTKNLTPGKRFCGEKILRKDKIEFRSWNPYTSKLGAAILKGLKNLTIKEGSKILYLGIAEGTTASYISDIIGEKGIIIGVEISEKPFQKLLNLCEARKNIIPVLGDANKPEEYADFVEEIGGVEIIYQDIAQKNQTEILLKNIEYFLRKGGSAIYMLKAKSIDVVKDPKDIYIEESKKISKLYEILEVLNLEPYEKDHACFVIKVR